MEIARPAARTLGRELGATLQARLAEEGPPGAARFCADRAQGLTARIERRVGGGLSLKRTSLRHRNPANAPDVQERRALLHFQGVVDEGGQLPEHRVERAAPGTFRYYQPLVVAPLCLQCHGPRESLDAGVRRLLDRRYPGDRATGYEVGDLRGVIRVAVPASRITEPSSTSSREDP